MEGRPEGMPKWVLIRNKIFSFVMAGLILLVLFSPAIAAIVVPIYQAATTGNMVWIFGIALVIPFIMMGNVGLKKVNGYLEGKLLREQERMFGTGDDLKRKIRAAIKNRIASSDTDYIDVDGVIGENLRTPPRLEFEYKG